MLLTVVLRNPATTSLLNTIYVFGLYKIKSTFRYVVDNICVFCEMYCWVIWQKLQICFCCFTLTWHYVKQPVLSYDRHIQPVCILSRKTGRCNRAPTRPVSWVKSPPLYSLRYIYHSSLYFHLWHNKASFWDQSVTRDNESKLFTNHIVLISSWFFQILLCVALIQRFIGIIRNVWGK